MKTRRRDLQWRPVPEDITETLRIWECRVAATGQRCGRAHPKLACASDHSAYLNKWRVR